MKNFDWKIKISDLLNNPWNTDTIEFKNRFLNEEIWISKEWISGKIFLEGLNHEEILLELKNLEFSIIYECDKCLEKYTKKYSINENQEKPVRFIIEKDKNESSLIHDDIFFIDTKNWIINIEEFISIIIKNQEPVVKNCWKHKNTKLSDKIKSQDNFSSYTFDFLKLLKK